MLKGPRPSNAAWRRAGRVRPRNQRRGTAMIHAAPTARSGPRRAEVLQAAERCIQRHGIRKTTMDDIAREAGTSRPSIYRHFADREELLLSLSTAHTRALTVRARAVIASRGSLSDRIVEGLLCLAED